MLTLCNKYWFIFRHRIIFYINLNEGVDGGVGYVHKCSLCGEGGGRERARVGWLADPGDV